jgi:hypothetical protein
MKNKFKIKQIILLLLIIIIVTAVISNFIYNNKSVVITVQEDNIVTENIIMEKVEQLKVFNLCYYDYKKIDNGFYDKSWLKLIISGEKIKGEFNNIPAEKDSKIGLFGGTVESLDQKIMGRRATVWWDSLAEGMNVKEELAIVFGDGSATVGFGEMIDRGDGVYIYKDKENLTYLNSMNQIDCDTLDEKVLVEKYIKENISTIATNKPVLGGAWYTISVIANGTDHNGKVIYEDGHIQSNAIFSYEYQKNPQLITVTEFEITKD